MAISRIKTWIAEVLTPTDLNAEFNNILNYLNSNPVALGGSLSVAGATSLASTLGVTGITSLLALLDLSGAAAGQIKFPATQNPASDVNTLDDYEEGTWTPADGSGAGLTFTGASGTYVKIGQMIYVTGVLVYPATANGANAIVSGLPYASASINRQVIPIALSSGASVPIFIISSAVQTIALKTIADVAITNATVSGIQFAFSGSYRAGA